MKRKAIENRIRAVAAFAEAGSDMCGASEKAHADALFSGAHWIFDNAKLIAIAPELEAAMRALMEDYNQQYQTLTDGQYGRSPSTPAWKAAVRLLRRVR